MSQNLFCEHSTPLPCEEAAQKRNWFSLAVPSPPVQKRKLLKGAAERSSARVLLRKERRGKKTGGREFNPPLRLYRNFDFVKVKKKLIPAFEWRKFKRGPQVVLPKDAGLLLGYAGIGEGDKVAEAGSGSGWLTLFLANVVGEKGKVYSYERREDFLELAKKNIMKAGFSERVEFKLKDASEGFAEKELDCVVLDCGDSHLLLVNAFAALRKGGLCVGFMPNAEQVNAFVSEGQKQGFEHWLSLESIVREWLVRERGTRPKNVGLVHTSFLSFLKKP